MPGSGVEVVDYDDEWPERAATLINELIVALGPRARRIDHIGSTAVPAMQAKNVLDIQVSVDDLDVAVALSTHRCGRWGSYPCPTNTIMCPLVVSTLPRSG